MPTRAIADRMADRMAGNRMYRLRKAPLTVRLLIMDLPAAAHRLWFSVSMAITSDTPKTLEFAN
jgi:hypothetical protein